MTKKVEVLQMLKDAGDRGVRSDEFYRRFNGRGVARIYDLRQDGYEIEGRPDGKFKRYRLLNVGVESDGWKGSQPNGQGLAEDRVVTLDSGVERLDSSPPGDAPPAISMYDPFEQWAA